MSLVTDLLLDLIRWDTRNPGGNEPALAEHLAQQLGKLSADQVEILESGAHASVLARYGDAPTLLVNAHLDTVPTAQGWSSPPLEPQLAKGHVYGLGAADTKGAIAAILAALAKTRPRNTLILFSGDEERTGSAMRAFVQSAWIRGIERAIVCEPTSLRLGVSHRGLLAFRATVRGQGGHSSRADHLPKPVVALAQLALALDQWGRGHLESGPPGQQGMCMNIAAIEGGAAFNIVPEQGILSGSVRPPPGIDLGRVERELGEHVPAGTEWEVTLRNPPFATREVARLQSLLGDPPVEVRALDFWTEAALLQQAGIDAAVFGPGDIACAHAPDEHVAASELEAAENRFAHLLAASR